MELWMMGEIPLRTYLTTRNKFRASDLKAEGLLDMIKSGSEILSYDDDGAAHIGIEGVLTLDGPDFIDRLFGVSGTSYNQIVNSLYDAEEKLDAEGSSMPIVLHVNSPGGMINGAEATASAVADVASRRRVVAVNEGVMASAAVWLSCASTEIVTLGRSPLTGSVGAVATVVELNSDEIKIYNFVNPESPDKTPDPSTDEGAKVYTDRVSSIYSIFRDDLVAGRAGRTSVEKVEGLRGAVVTAQDAIEVGLVDRIIDRNTDLYTPAELAGNEDGSAIQARDREERMNLSEFLNEHPEAQADMDARISQARGEGETAAGKRHAEIVATLKPFMGGEYPERVKTACADAISGTRSLDSVLDLVALFDELKAQKEGDQSDEEQDELPEVPADGPRVVAEVEEAAQRDNTWNEAINKLLG